MDYSYYRELIPDVVLAGIEPVAKPVAGGINASWGYQSGLMVAVCKFGAGEFILNPLLIRENLGSEWMRCQEVDPLANCAAR
jgi:hypothetical protein